MYGFLPWLGRFQRGRGLTQAAGTAIVDLVAPMKGAFTRLVELSILAGATAHTIYLLRPLNYTTTSAAAVSGQAVVALTADPGVYSTNYQYPPLNSDPGAAAPATLPTYQTADNPVAANDYLAFETPDGAFYFDKVASVSGLNVTMTSNLPAGGIAAGARVWHFGTVTDKDPATGAPPFQYLLTASQLNTLSANSGGGNDLLGALHVYDPLLFYDANATAADTLQRLEGFYSRF